MKSLLKPGQCNVLVNSSKIFFRIKHPAVRKIFYADQAADRTRTRTLSYPMLMHNEVAAVSRVSQIINLTPYYSLHYTMQLCIIVVFAFLARSQAKLLKLTCEDKEAFVNGHNMRRLMIAKGELPGQPAAANMKHIIWDEELEKKAAKWASKNRFSHNPDMTIGSKRFATVDNLFLYWSPEPISKIEIEEALVAWFDREYVHYKYGPMVPRPAGAPQVGHYTQMAWADTAYIGCAMTRNTGIQWTKFFLVCNYGPGGNIYGHYPYKTAEPNNKRGLICVHGNKCNRKTC
ncbi:hypothetical protein evm_010535 [Chilo suppressalis]|nr:hypothetical protein evm_010535 [Chilo suppressalis]